MVTVSIILDYPSNRPTPFDVMKALCIYSIHTLCVLYKVEGTRKRVPGEKARKKKLTTVEAFPKLLTLCISFPKIMVLHYSPKAECKYFLTDFFYFFIFTERLLTKVTLICQKLN